jgi:asparagine synthase (glutamine-hydrolysing)
MCGIFGVCRRAGLTDGDHEVFERLSQTLIHRGPDGEGRTVGPQLALGMRRLSIVDVEHGWQPLWNEDRSVALVGNGEIYNHVQLRRELEARGHSFATRSDMEVAVHLFEEDGPLAVRRLRGMFALAFFDIRSGQLVLARDRLGEKPLFVAESREGFVFASELRALVASRAVELRFDTSVVPLYLEYGYLPEPLTMVRGVRKVEAGTFESFDLGTGAHSVRSYWDFDEGELDQRAPAEQVRSVLEDVAELVVRADVPVGIALSSGIDSTLVASLAVRHATDLHAFTVGYVGDQESDESADAVRIANELGLTPHVVKLHPDDVADTFSELCLRRDEPIADIAGSGYDAVARLARDNSVPVLLNGQGGDELFWGYGWVRSLVLDASRRRATVSGAGSARDYLRLQRPPATPGLLLDWLSEGAGLVEGWRRWRTDRADSVAAAPQMCFYDRQPRALQIQQARNRLTAPSASVDPLVAALGPESWDDLPGTYTRLIMSSYLRVNGLAQMDRLAMAHSVEARTPLVDHRLVETVLALRRHHPDHEGVPKSLLRDATRDLVPAWVLALPKRGFTPPVRTWVDRIHARHRTSFADPRSVVLGIVTLRAVAMLASPRSWNGRLGLMWVRLAVLELWVRGMEDVGASPLSESG